MEYVMSIRSIRVSHIVLSTKDIADLLLDNLKSCESNELMLKMFSKLAKKYSSQGKKVMIAAGDTFRAAAVEQLTVWSNLAGAKIVSGKQGSDAAGLVYDAIDQARSEGVDILMIDTAGRLQNRTELMDELEKIVKNHEDFVNKGKISIMGNLKEHV